MLQQRLLKLFFQFNITVSGRLLKESHLIPVGIKCIKNLSYMQIWGRRWHSWLRYCVKSWKVACSITEGVTGIYHWINFSVRNIDLRLSQPLTKISIVPISWYKRPVRRAAYLTTFMYRLSKFLGVSAAWRTWAYPKNVDLPKKCKERPNCYRDMSFLCSEKFPSAWLKWRVLTHQARLIRHSSSRRVHRKCKIIILKAALLKIEVFWSFMPFRLSNLLGG
jgi:hypothetical protein